MGRRRKPENAIYPAGVYPSRGWLFFNDKAAGRKPKICRISEWDTQVARKKWAEMSVGQAELGTVADMLDGLMKHRELLLREKKIAARTYTDNLEYVTRLKTAFGRMLPHQVTMRDCTSYLDKRSWTPRPKKGPDGTLIAQAPRRAPVRANKELSLFSEGFKWAMKSTSWPLVTNNPCIGVERNPTKASDRCPERSEMDAAKKHAPGIWPLILDLAYKAGSRGVQFRLLPKRNIRDEGLLIGKAKGGADVWIEWDDELVGIVEGLLTHANEISAKLRVQSPYLIVARGGGPYTAHGWKTTMFKLVRAAIAAGDLEHPFSFHNIRSRSATDEEELFGTNPQHRLGHKKRATTDDYMRGKRAKRVKPLPLRKAS